jgi:hypothetical protein
VVRRVEFISDRMSYIILRGRWCNVIVLNVRVPYEDKGNGVKYSFYEELGRVFDHYSRYDMKMLLDDFNAKVGRENIFEPTFGNESLHEISTDNEVRVVNFATFKNYLSKAQCSRIAKFINTPGPLLRETHTANPSVPQPCASEAEVAIGKLRRYKSPGVDRIPAELIQGGGETLRSEIHKLIKLI